jgi:hypothetical protein
MKSFHFPLQKALDWRSTQLGLEEVRYKQRVFDLAELDRTRAEVEASGMRAEVQVREWGTVASCDLMALGNFRLRARKLEAQIRIRRIDASNQLAAQQQKMLEARRRCRLLERLKERRLAEWTLERDHEVEEIAAESYLARWNREV